MKQFFSIALVAAGAFLASAQGAREALFKLWDRNEDGKLVLNELPPNAKPNFLKVDTNKDGAISPAEHKTFLTTAQRHVHLKASKCCAICPMPMRIIRGNDSIGAAEKDRKRAITSGGLDPRRRLAQW